MPESITTTARRGRPPPTSTRWAATRRESARLQRQSGELRSDSTALLDRVGLGPGRARLTWAAGRAGSSSCWPSGSRRAGASWAWTLTRPTSRWPGSSPVSAALGNVDDRGGGCPAHRPAVELVRPGARPYPAGQRARTRRGPGRDGPAGQAGRLGGQPGARRRVRAVLPRSSGLDPAVPDLPCRVQPERRRPAHRPPPDPAIPRGRPAGHRGRGAGGHLPGQRHPPHGPA